MGLGCEVPGQEEGPLTRTGQGAPFHKQGKAHTCSRRPWVAGRRAGPAPPAGSSPLPCTPPARQGRRCCRCRCRTRGTAPSWGSVWPQKPPKDEGLMGAAPHPLGQLANVSSSLGSDRLGVRDPVTWLTAASTPTYVPEAWGQLTDTQTPQPPAEPCSLPSSLNLPALEPPDLTLSLQPPSSHTCPLTEVPICGQGTPQTRLCVPTAPRPPVPSHLSLAPLPGTLLPILHHVPGVCPVPRWQRPHPPWETPALPASPSTGQGSTALRGGQEAGQCRRRLVMSHSGGRRARTPPGARGSEGRKRLWQRVCGCPGPLAAGWSPASQHHRVPAPLPWRQVPLTTRGSLMAAGCPNSVSIFQVT